MDNDAVLLKLPGNQIQTSLDYFCKSNALLILRKEILNPSLKLKFVQRLPLNVVIEIVQVLAKSSDLYPQDEGSVK